MILFTHLKIILLQCFQFLGITGIQTQMERGENVFFFFTGKREWEKIFKK